MLAGATEPDKLSIAPLPGMPMAGCAVEGGGSGALDPLYARALMLEGRSDEVPIAVLDATRVDFEPYRAIGGCGARAAPRGRLEALQGLH